MDSPRQRRPARSVSSTNRAADDSGLSSMAAARVGQVNSWRTVGWPALASSLGLWAAHAPLGWSWLAWFAPLGLLSIIARPTAIGPRGYFLLWLAGCVFWLAILQGIRLAFWPLYFGWIALSLYLAVYTPLFVGVARELVHRWRWPLVVAAPVAWTGWELWRSYILTGYAGTTLAHSQYSNPLVIQLADQVGGYGIGFIIMVTSVAIFRLVHASQRRAIPDPLWELGVAGGLLCLLFGYGAWRLNEGDDLAANNPPLLHAALIQENTPSQFDADPQRLEMAWKRYASMTERACSQAARLDLIIWPESTFTAMIPWVEDHIQQQAPPEMQALNYDRHSVAQKVAELQVEFAQKTRLIQDRLRAISGHSTGLENRTLTLDADQSQAVLPQLLVGNDVMEMHDDRVRRYNSALLIDEHGQIVNRYEKMHLVMFGEYIPLGWALKFLGDAFGLVSADAGQETRAFQLGGVNLSPSICFESMVPHLLHWQIRSLRNQGNDPDVLVTITNDSWFRGSSLLDHHLASEVLAAVELRRPFLVAANTGITAWIGGSGRIVERLERLEPGFIVAAPTRDSRWAMTQLWGDAPAWCSALIVAAVTLRLALARLALARLGLARLGLARRRLTSPGSSRPVQSQ